MSRVSRRRLTAFAAPLALLAASAPVISADPWIWSGQFRVQHRPPIVVARGPRHAPPPPVVIVRQMEAFPCELRLSAYQTRDIVIVVANGANGSAGYATCLTVHGEHDRSPTVVLRNTAPAACVSQVVTPFEVTGSFRTRSCLRTLSVRVADRCLEVPVVQVPGIS